MVTVDLSNFQLECKRCGHRWIPRKPDVRICPKCKSPYWDKERTPKKVNTEADHGKS